MSTTTSFFLFACLFIVKSAAVARQRTQKGQHGPDKRHDCVYVCGYTPTERNIQRAQKNGFLHCQPSQAPMMRMLLGCVTQSDRAGP